MYKKDIYSQYAKYSKNFVTSRLTNNNEENYLGQLKNNVLNNNLVMPSEYVKLTYPRLLSQYKDYYFQRENELSEQLIILDYFDEFGKIIKKKVWYFFFKQIKIKTPNPYLLILNEALPLLKIVYKLKQKNNQSQNEFEYEEKWGTDIIEKRKRKQKKGHFYDNISEELFSNLKKNIDEKIPKSESDFKDAFEGTEFVLKIVIVYQMTKFLLKE